MPGFTEKPRPVEVPGLVHVHSGKVREIYRDAAGNVVLVATDRISAYDWVLATEIPGKGRILTRLSQWWFDQVADLVPNHVISTDPPPGAPADWEGRTMTCRPLGMLPVEAVARGYLTGSGLEEYQQHRTVCGVALPPGLVDGSELPAPIFTPATKSAIGDHDVNVSYEDVARQLGPETAAQLRQASLALYSRGRDIARDRGIILADTKFEFGREDGAGPDGPLILADEIFTPDSSRFWRKDEWQPGQRQQPYDKQYIRDWLASPASGWDRTGSTPPPPLPEEVVERTRERYAEAFRMLTGMPWD